MPSDRSPFTSIHTALESTAKFVALLSALCIALSVVYDWGFLAGLNLTFNEVPTTLADHARSAVTWAPLVALVLPAAIFFNAVADSAFPDPPVPKKADSERRRYVVLVCGTLAGVLIWLALGDAVMFFAAALSGASLWGIGLIYMRRRSRPRSVEVRVLEALLVLPLIAGGMLWLGYDNSRQIVNRGAVGQLIALRSPGGEALFEGTLVRSFERVTILIDRDRGVVLAKSDDIAKAMLGRVTRANTGLLCKAWGIGCPLVLRDR